MKAKRCWILAVGLTLCAGILWAANPSKDEPNMPKSVVAKTQRDALKGLEGVRVVVTPIEPGVKKYLSEEQIQNDVELLLRKYGVTVLTKKEMLGTRGMPLLMIIVQTVTTDQLLSDVLYAVAINTELSERVWLVRNPTMMTDGVIWSDRTVVLVGSDK